VGSLLAALTTIIVTVLAVALAAPYVLDWNDYKYAFEAQATKMIGRPVRVDGAVGLTILPVPEVSLKGVRVADETGGFSRPFAEAENFNMTLSLAPLLSGTIQAQSIELDQPVIRFQVGANGQGNWTTLGPAQTARGVPAREVVLSNVTIRDGAIEYRDAPGATATRIDRISGSFAADSLSGPFRFTGFGAIGRDRRELKLSVSRAQRDNAFRLKASLGSPGGGSLYQLDGDVKTIDGVMQYNGPVLARLEIGGAVSGKGDRQDKAPRAKAVELRAGSAISLRDARLQDIALTVTENDRPQSFTGSAYAAWGEEPRLDLSVQTAFLDIDQMIGTGGKTDPLAAIAALPQIFEGWAFEPRQGKIRATIQQATLGGDTLEGITFAAAHNREFWQVETLEARLPGDAPVSVQGVLQPGKNVGFTGEFNLSGRNLPKLLRWAAPSLGAVDTGDAQRFSLKGGMTYAGDRFTFRRGAGELGDSTFSGDLAYDFSANSKLMLTLQSDRLDLRSIYGGNPFAADEAPAPAAADPKAGKTSLLDAFRTVFQAKESQISLRIAQLSMPDLEARDVRTSFRYENGNLDIRELNIATTDGLSIKADGALTNFGASPNGTINLGVNAPSTASLANLARLFGLESFGTAAHRRMDALAPLRLTGRLSGNKQDRLMNLTLAGSAAGSELALNGRFDGEFNALKDARLDLNGTIANGDGRRLIAQLAPEVPLGTDAVRPGAGVLKISALGVLKTGLISKLELRTPEAEGRFEGQLMLLDNPAWGLNGDLWLRAGQASTALSMLRLSPGGTPVSGELDLRAALSKKAGTFKVENVSLQIGGETIAGNATVDVAGERPVANVDVRATTLMLPKLAAYLVDWDRKDASAAEGMLSGKSASWPNQSFAFRTFDAVEGSLKVKAPSLTLTDGVTLANGQLDASMKGGTLTVEALKGQIYSGNFTGSGTLAATNGRVILKGRLKLDKADLARLTVAGDGKPLAKSTGEFRLAFSGEGLSPRGLLSVLSGKGRVKLGKGTLFGLSPAVLGQAADTYLTEEIPQQAKLTQRIAKDLRPATGTPSVPFRGFLAPVVLKDGVIEIRRAGFKSPDYLATANLFVDLSSNRLDSEWGLFWRGKSKVLTDPTAPIRLVFAGPLADFTKLQPQIQTEQYERLLSMQRMDKDMDRLEKLNRAPAPLQQPSGTASREQLVTRPPTLVPTAPATVLGAQPPVSQSPATGTATPPPAASLSPNDGLATRPTATPAQPSAPPPPPAGWTAGVEDAGKAPARAQGNAAQPPRAFEDQIRGILEQQRNNTSQQTPPAPNSAAPQKGPQSNLSYQTQSYSQTASDTNGGASPQRAEEEAALEAQNVPLPERRTGAPPKKSARPPASFWSIFQ
jgi:uncharacterized protein involved in outer membrane biogenesis